MVFTFPVLSPGPAEFAFGCNRCGNCCSNQTGFVWIEPDEIAPMAEKLQMTAEAFARRFVKNVDGRLSLIEESGRCALLANRTDCSVYEARPRQCRNFPFWLSVLEGGEHYKNARDLCPGIFEAPRRAAREAAYAELREFYKSADDTIAALRPKCELSGKCCNFPEYGHKLYATILETDFAAEHGPDDGARDATGGAIGVAERGDWCAFYHFQRCHARETRPLACRTYFCDPDTTAALIEVHERLLAELRALARRHAWPDGYGDFTELLPARRAAIALLDKSRGDA